MSGSRYLHNFADRVVAIEACYVGVPHVPNFYQPKEKVKIVGMLVA
jgi:hypothetical protein